MNKKNIFILLSIIAVLIFITISILVVNNNISWFDNPIYNFLSKFINDTNTNIFKAITSLGSAKILIALALIITVLLWRKSDYILYGSMLIITLETSQLLVTFLKGIFERERPNILRLVTENSHSFPSAHSLISMCFYGFLIYLTYKIVKGNIKYVIYVCLGLLILLIGMSRIYLGIHYASDVLAGFSIGFVWLMLFICLTNQAVRMNKREIRRKIKKQV